MMITCNAQFGRSADANLTSTKRLSPVRRRGRPSDRAIPGPDVVEVDASGRVAETRFQSRTTFQRH